MSVWFCPRLRARVCGGRLLVVCCIFALRGGWALGGVFCACCVCGGGWLVRAVFEAVPSLLAVPLSLALVRSRRTNEEERSYELAVLGVNMLMLCGLSAAAALHAQPRMMRITSSMGVRMLSSSGDDLSKLTVVELKEKLRAAGLRVSGRKAELIERLNAAARPAESDPIPASASSASTASPFASMLFPEQLNPTFPPIAIEACKS